jgi:hypothetical protein
LLILTPVYAATVWNTYRKIRLLTLDVIIRCSKRLEKRNSFHNEENEAEELLGDLFASIPFHLFSNSTKFARQADNVLGLAIIPGKSIGGLLLMAPLFVISNFSIVSPKMQVNMRECLAWIGTNMGIGQATILSKV